MADDKPKTTQTDKPSTITSKPEGGDKSNKLNAPPGETKTADKNQE